MITPLLGIAEPSSTVAAGVSIHDADLSCAGGSLTQEGQVRNAILLSKASSK